MSLTVDARLRRLRRWPEVIVIVEPDFVHHCKKLSEH